MIHRFAAAAALIPALGSAALAQSQEYTLEPGKDQGGESWVQTEQAPTTGDAGIMAKARKDLAAKDPSAAIRAMNAWIDEHDGTDNKYLPEAYLIRADSYLAQTYEYKSLYDYEHLIKTYPASPQFLVAVQREFDIGTRYLNGLRKRVLGIRLANGSDIGVELLIRVQERVPGSQLAERAAIELADYYYDKREMKLARDAYELYLLNYPNGPNRMHAEKRLIYADVARFKGPRYDAAGLLDARVRIRNFAARYPIEAERSGVNEGLIARIDESMAAQLLDAARWYMTQKDHAAVRYTLRRLVQRYPRTIAAAQAMQILEKRGWLGALEKEKPAGTKGPIVIEGPGSEQVKPVSPPEKESAPASKPPQPEPESPRPTPPPDQDAPQ